MTGPEPAMLLCTSTLLVLPVGLFAVMALSGEVTSLSMKKVPWMPQVSKPVLVLGAVLLLLSSVVSLFWASCTEPGILPRQDPKRGFAGCGKRPPRVDQIINGVKVSLKWCSTCEIYRPPLDLSSENGSLVQAELYMLCMIPPGADTELNMYESQDEVVLETLKMQEVRHYKVALPSRPVVVTVSVTRTSGDAIHVVEYIRVPLRAEVHADGSLAELVAVAQWHRALYESPRRGHSAAEWSREQCEQHYEAPGSNWLRNGNTNSLRLKRFRRVTGFVGLDPGKAPLGLRHFQETGPRSRTTLVLKNLPRHFDKDALKDLLEKLGFRGFFDFLYVPLQWNQESCVGYGLVNLTSHEALCFRWNFFCIELLGASENLEVCWDTRHQGLDQLIKYYRNNSVMHPLLPEHCKPMLLLSGEKVDFPPPTKARLRESALHGNDSYQNLICQGGWQQ
ncbi:unnamed protein product [Durusdinium trenchii]|uniref:Mei2-like C-terminal RNA recognition motif domain-containing protein n=1 Tax=Durusdinium trenchii TaxID=1381693 RepID=A0ABP0KND1_9DINO